MKSADPIINKGCNQRNHQGFQAVHHKLMPNMTLKDDMLSRYIATNWEQQRYPCLDVAVMGGTDCL
jgi:hypothetical protein